MKYFFAFFLLSISFTFSQELNCTVTTNYEGLPVNNRELLVDFANVVESYMNKTQFTSEILDGEKINCSLTIFFTGASGDNDYTAQVVVVSTRPVYKSTKQSPILTINDPNWSFRYVVNQSMYANQSTFDPLTSFLDFYANLIIGFDWETWADLGGSPYFRKAFDIINLSLSNPYSKGWEQNNSSYSRWGLCQDLTNDKYRPFREAFYTYHYGVDEYQIRKKEAQEKIANLVNVLFDMQIKTGINGVLIKQFFDTKNGEIVNLLKNYNDPNILLRLKKIDPSHAAKYDEMLK
jgi:hypothetical protein